MKTIELTDRELGILIDMAKSSINNTKMHIEKLTQRDPQSVLIEAHKGILSVKESILTKLLNNPT